jgi:DNA-binding transcriptional regulator YdaS (Cro superfamily)
MSTPLSALNRAFEFFGDPTVMAGALGLTSRELWVARYRNRVSGQLAERIERVTGGTVRREELRPDLYPKGEHFNRIRVRKINERRQRRR